MPDRFREHRAALASRIGDGGIAVVPAATEAIRNHDVHHSFRQDSAFHYLTGFHEPDAVAVLTPGHSEGDFHLFVNPRDREVEIWTGYRDGVEGALTHHQADTAHPLADLDDVLPRLMVGRDTLFYRLGNPHQDDRMTSLLEKARSIRTRHGRAVPVAIHDLSAVLSELRLRKSPAEIESLEAACVLSAEGHREAMRFCRPGMYEYQVQAAMEYVWREAGSPRNGYPSIVAAGPNAIILHYIDNDRMIESGDLVLVDAAAEVDMYSSDITRTFPASGHFSPPQRAVYDVVLAAQKAGIHESRPGATLRNVHEASLDILVEGMVELGLIPTSADDALTMHLYREFYMHGTSHWLGLDVHDAGAVRVDGKPRVLEPGMVFTVEPGIYIGADRPEVEFTLLEHDLDAWTERRLMLGAHGAKLAEDAERESADTIMHEVPEELLGIGVRIEDDILITDEGHRNLSSLVPTDPEKVEALCAEGSWLHRE